MNDVLIVGGGIIGLSLAFELSRRGMSVTVVEQGEWGGQASSAAAGMLAPLKEFTSPGPNLDLGMQSMAIYPQWAREVEEASGVGIQFCLDGLLTVAMNEHEAKQLWDKYEWQRSSGYEVSWMEGGQLHEVEPLLSPNVIAGTFSVQEGHINNRLLLQALVNACQLQGVKMMRGAVVTDFLFESGQRVVGAQIHSGKIFARETLLTAGAWTGLLAERLGITLPIRPVRGQVAAVASAGIPLRRIIFGTSGYIAPKKDGKIVIGATEDEAGYSKEVTLSGLAQVCNGVLPYVPALHQASFLQAWAGLRPATADGKPFLGPIPGWQGIALASGHFRNGILLSPVTAKLMADWVEKGDTSLIAPFLPARLMER